MLTIKEEQQKIFLCMCKGQLFGDFNDYEECFSPVLNKSSYVTLYAKWPAMKTGISQGTFERKENK